MQGYLMQNRCCAIGCFLNFISQLYFAAGIYCLHGKLTFLLKFHFGQIDRSEICTEVSFTTPYVMWTLIMKLPHTEVKFYLEVKSQTGLSSLRVSCKRAQVNFLDYPVQ